MTELLTVEGLEVGFSTDAGLARVLERVEQSGSQVIPPAKVGS